MNRRNIFWAMIAAIPITVRYYVSLVKTLRCEPLKFEDSDDDLFRPPGADWPMSWD